MHYTQRRKILLQIVTVVLAGTAFVAAPGLWYRGVLIVQFLPVASAAFFWGAAAGVMSASVILPIFFFILPFAAGVREMSILALDDLAFHVLLNALVALVTIGAFAALRRLLNRLQSKERFYRTIVDHTYDSEYWIDPEGNLLYQSDSIEQITGYPVIFFTAEKDRFVSIVHPDDRKGFIDEFTCGTSESDRPAPYQYRIITRNGEVRWMETTYRKIFSDEEKCLGKRGSTRDITRRKQIQQALEESERNLRTLVNTANSAIIKYDMSGRITFFNKYAERLFGYSREEVLHRKGIETINKPRDPGKKAEVEILLQDILNRTEAYSYNENENRRKDGTVIWMAWTNAPLYTAEKRKSGILCVGTDKTEQKKAEELLKTSLVEKETLLKEIHHRVKNNLQVISSLLNLQNEHYTAPGFSEVLRKCENRISSIALVHEQIYQSENLTSVEMYSYISALSRNLFDSYTTDPNRLRLTLDIEDVHLHIDTAIPLGLILSELLSNSIKHAFPDDATGSILICLVNKPAGIQIVVQDDGIGIPEQEIAARGNTLGLKLVDALANQINCSLSVSSGPGTRWVLELSTLADGCS